MKNIQQKRRYFWYAGNSHGPGRKLAAKVSSFTGAASSSWYPSREQSHIPPWEKKQISFAHALGIWINSSQDGGSCFYPSCSGLCWKGKPWSMTGGHKFHKFIAKLKELGEGATATVLQAEAEKASKKIQKDGWRLSAVILWMKEVRLTSWGW